MYVTVIQQMIMR